MHTSMLYFQSTEGDGAASSVATAVAVRVLPPATLATAAYVNVSWVTVTSVAGEKRIG